MAFETSDIPHPEDTIVAAASAPGAGRRAVVRLSGPLSHAIVRKVFDPKDLQQWEQRRRWLEGQLRLSQLRPPVPATVLRFFTPYSYTGQDMAEVHLPGSPPLVEQLIADLLRHGGRPAQPGEFTLRAFLAGKKDLAQAEAVQAVVEADDAAALQQALRQLAGGISHPLHRLRETLLDLLADIEAALDFVDEDITFVSAEEAIRRLSEASEQIAALLQQTQSRGLSRTAARIVFVGLPNAGKSSLFNALGGGQAIVSPIPGTTRDYLIQSCDWDGVPVELVDTAGWQEAADTIEQQAQQLGCDAACTADVVVWCDEHGRFPAEHVQLFTNLGAELVRVRTKADLGVLPGPATSEPSAADVVCSIHNSMSVKELRKILRERLLRRRRPGWLAGLARCRHHLEMCGEQLQAAIHYLAAGESMELVALALREALHQLGCLTGAVYTNDLLDRIFSRFCIGK